MTKKLTVEEVKKIAYENYEKGGSWIIECWTDQNIQDWIDGTGEETKPHGRQDLDELLKFYHETRDAELNQPAK